MPGSKQPEEPYAFLNALAHRVDILERARRLSSFIGAQAIKNSNQSISTGLGSVTLVTFAAVDFDTDAFFDDTNDRFVVPDDLDGYYNIYGKVEWETGTGPVRVRLRYNGTGFTENYYGSTVVTTSVPISINKYLNAGDYVELVVSHDQGTNRNVMGSGDDYDTHFGLQFLGG